MFSNLHKEGRIGSRILGKRILGQNSRLLRAIPMQAQLIQRITRLAQYLHLLISSIQSSELGLEAEALRGKLEETEEEMRRAQVKG